MSGFIGVLAAGGGALVANPLSSGSVINTLPTSNSGSATITFKSDGSITRGVTGTGAAMTGSAPAQWAITVAAGIGTGVYIRVTPTVGTFTTNPAAAFVQLTSDQAIVIGPTAADKSTTATVEFSYDGSTVAVSVVGWSWTITHV